MLDQHKWSPAQRLGGKSEIRNSKWVGGPALLSQIERNANFALGQVDAEDPAARLNSTRNTEEETAEARPSIIHDDLVE